MNQDLEAIQPKLNTVKVTNWLFALLSNVFMQLYIFTHILHTENMQDMTYLYVLKLIKFFRVQVWHLFKQQCLIRQQH